MDDSQLWKIESVPIGTVPDLYGKGVRPGGWTFVFGPERITEARLRDLGVEGWDEV